MKKILLALVLLPAVILFGLNHGTSAQSVNDFVINSFDADYVLSNQKAGGKLVTTEDIDLTFSAYNHGILRAIPVDYKNWSTKIKVKNILRDGNNEEYSTYDDSNGNLVLKIGQAYKTITGHHIYKVVYEQHHVINFDGPNPEFFWDVNGSEWSQYFSHVSATVHLPDNAISSSDPVCFTGSFKSTEQNCTFKRGNNEIIFSTTGELGPRQNMTIAVPLNQGAFNKPTTADFIRDNIVNILGLAAGIFLSIAALIIWFFRGRDHSGRGVIIPEYDPPKSITPAELGLLADYNVDSRDITATMIDLAVRGYIRIYEDTKKKLFISRKNYKLELLKNDYSGLKDHEEQVIEAIFTTSTIGDLIEMNKIDKLKMSKAVVSIRKDLQKSLTDKYGYFEKDAKKLGTTMSVIGGLTLFGSFFLFGTPAPWTGLGGVIAGISFLAFGQLMPRRSHAGTEVYEKIQGLKLYMNTAEKDRLKMLQSVDRPYAEPSKTVELYEKLLPYAIALGVEKSWTKQFEGILNEAPGWYSGTNFATFNAAVFASSIGSVNSNFGSSFTSSSSSGGGGFSGGGGGGGGGGGW